MFMIDSTNRPNVFLRGHINLYYHHLSLSLSTYDSSRSLNLLLTANICTKCTVIPQYPWILVLGCSDSQSFEGKKKSVHTQYSCELSNNIQYYQDKLVNSVDTEPMGVRADYWTVLLIFIFFKTMYLYYYYYCICVCVSECLCVCVCVRVCGYTLMPKCICGGQSSTCGSSPEPFCLPILSPYFLYDTGFSISFAYSQIQFCAIYSSGIPDRLLWYRVSPQSGGFWR